MQGFDSNDINQLEEKWIRDYNECQKHVKTDNPVPSELKTKEMRLFWSAINSLTFYGVTD